MKKIRITSKKAGFRRGGMAHPAEPVEYPAKSIGKEALAAIKAEPLLVVEEFDEPDKKAEEK